MKEHAYIPLVDKKDINPIAVLEGISPHHLPRNGISSLVELDQVLRHEAVFLETQLNNTLLAPKRDDISRMRGRLDKLNSLLEIPLDTNARREWMNEQAERLEGAGHPYWQAFEKPQSTVTAVSVYELNKKFDNRG